jgi:hypothetical protein
VIKNRRTQILETLNDDGFSVNFVTAEVSLSSRHIDEVEIIMALSNEQCSWIARYERTVKGYILHITSRTGEQTI